MLYKLVTHIKDHTCFLKRLFRANELGVFYRLLCIYFENKLTICRIYITFIKFLLLVINHLKCYGLCPAEPHLMSPFWSLFSFTWSCFNNIKSKRTCKHDNSMLIKKHLYLQTVTHNTHFVMKWYVKGHKCKRKSNKKNHLINMWTVVPGSMFIFSFSPQTAVRVWRTSLYLSTDGTNPEVL